VLEAVQNVHAMIDKEIAAGTDPNNVFVCGFSQGGFPFALPLQRPHTHTQKKKTKNKAEKDDKYTHTRSKTSLHSLIFFNAGNLKILTILLQVP
jgi:acetyl esterase/lipase